MHLARLALLGLALFGPALSGARPALADGLIPRGTTSLGLCYAAGSSGAQVPCVLSGQTWLRVYKPGDNVAFGALTAASASAPFASVGRPTSDPGAIWVNNDNLLGSFVPGRVKQFVISDNGGYSALVTASRTSDNLGAADSILSDTCLSVNDNATIAHMNWCRYTHTSLKAGSKVSLSLGEENSLENLSSYSVPIDPFSNVGPGTGVTGALRLTSGIGRPANDISSYLQMINNGGARALAGIVFSWDAFNMASGYASAMSMGPGQGLTWWNGAGNPGWRIFANGNQGTGTVILGNNTFDLYIGTGGERPLAISPGQVQVNDRLVVGDLLQVKAVPFANLPGSAAAGSVLFCSDCREPGQSAGTGTGILVVRSTAGWRAVAGGAAAN